MKRLLLLCCLGFAFAASAQDAPAPAVKPLRGATPSNVTVINGKKFFSLSNAKHFTGSVNSPKALSVMHAPRPAGTIASHHAAAPFSEPTPGGPLNTEGNAPADKVLSIFAPDEKAPLPNTGPSSAARHIAPLISPQGAAQSIAPLIAPQGSGPTK